MKPRFTISFSLIAYLTLTSSLLLTSASSDKSTSISASGVKGRSAAEIFRPQAPSVLKGQTATLLADGRWLMVGGEGADGPLSRAEIKDPATGATATVPGTLNTARAWHSATMLPNGTVLIFGGIIAGGRITDSLEVFNPEAGSFKRLPPVAGLAPRAYHTATLLTDGRVFIVGGESATGLKLRAVVLLDPDKMKAVSVRAQSQAARRKHVATLLPDGSVLLEGGPSASEAEVYDDERYDPEGQSFAWGMKVLGSEYGAGPYLAASLPADGSSGAPTDTRVALRFSRPLLVKTVNAETITLTGPQGIVDAKVVPAEGGMLAFVTTKEPLLAGTTYTLSIAGCVDASNQGLANRVVTFTTADQPEPGTVVDDERWTPELKNLKGDWRCNRPESQWQKLPPLRAEEGVTALAGQTLTLSGLPLAGVTMRIGERAAVTDRTGRFLLTGLASGHQVLRIDGRTASRPRAAYGLFKVGVDLETGKTTALNYVIWMPKLDMAHASVIPSPTRTDVVITNPTIPGLELHLPAGTVIRDMDGQMVSQLTITPVPTDRAPFPLPDLKVPVFFTIQPGGAQVIPPRARLIYPNFTTEPPGARIDFWNYDPEEKGWYVYGQGTVSPSGKQIIPDAGVVIYEFTGVMVANPVIAPPEGPRPGNTNAAGGDPVDLSTGLFVYGKTDLFLPDTMPISLARTYRPRDTVSRPFGIGTTHPYDIFIVGDTHPYTYTDLILPNGGRVHFNRISAGTSFGDAVYEHTDTPSEFYKAQIKYVNGAWDLTLKNGTVYRFPDAENVTIPRQAALLSMRDRYGNALTLTRDSSRNLTRITSPNGRWIEFTYDTSNRISQAKDNVGRTVSYAYDDVGRLAKVTDPKSGVTEYTYDASNRMLTIKDARGLTYLTNEYDANGRVIKQTQADNATYAFAYTLDAGGKVTQTDITDPRGNVRRLNFNTSGYSVKETRALGKPEQQIVTYERQAATNFLLSVTDALSRKTTYAYDSLGNVTSINRLPGTTEAAMTTFTYEPTFNQVASVKDPLGHTTSFTYDARGSLTGVTDPLSNQTTFTYNAAGQLTSVINPLGNTVRYTYDAGYLAAVSDPLGNTTSMISDRVGRTISATDPLGRLTVYEYDALNQLVKMFGPQGEEVSMTYDANGNRLSVKDARGATTRYAYDNMDRLISRTDPLLKVESYQYNAAGGITQVTDRRGKITTLTYDNLSRVIFTGFGLTGTDYESSITNTYDAGNRLTKVLDSQAGAETFTYDKLDRLKSATTPQGAVNYTYDKGGRRTGLTVAGQPVVSYAYDDANRLIKITQGTSAIAFDYNDAGRRTSVTLPNGIIISYSYNDASQLTGINYQKGAASIGDLTYGYDAAGRRITVGGSFARTGLPPAASSMTYNVANQLTKAGAKTLTYDGNGNLLNDGVNSYNWDARNRLTSISGPGLTASFTYDAFGRRVKKSVNGAVTDYLYDGGNAVQETFGGTTKANLINGEMDELYIRKDAAGSQTALPDALGSTVALADSTGTLKTQYTYEPFGKTTASGTTSLNPSQYAGRDNDGTGLYYNRARYYSPTLQRFISQDPLEFSGSPTLNLYSYALNNPVNFIDPSGASPTLITAGIGAGIGGIVSGVIAYSNGGSWSDVGQAVAVGAIAGGVAGLTLGLAGPAIAGWAGGGVMGGVLSGAVSSGVGNSTAQGLNMLLGRQCDFSGDDLALAVGAGALSGGILLRPATAMNQNVASWASRGITPDLNSGRWVMTGGGSFRNWMMSGTVRTTPMGNYTTGAVPGSSLSYPPGWESFKGLLGQRVIQ